MSRSRQTLDLARREFVSRAKSKAFLVTMLVIFGGLALIGPIVALTQRSEAPIRIGVVGEIPQGLESALSRQADRDDVEFEIAYFGTTGEAESALEAGRADVVMVGSTELIWKEDVSGRAARLVGLSLDEALTRSALADLGIDPETVDRTLDQPGPTNRTLVPPDPEETPRRVGAFIGMFVLYVSILVFGQFVAMGTVEEKQNRVVEVVLARVRPAQILIGKVSGIGLLGLVQLLLLVVAAVIAIMIVQVDGVSLPRLGTEIIAGVLFWFFLGYAFYAFVYATLGATVSRQEDLQSVLMLPLVFIVPGFFLAQFAAENPEGTLVRVASMLPPWSPMVMPVRSAVGGASALEVVVAVVLIVVAIVLLVRVGERVYTGALLRTGGKVKLREAWRAARA